MKKPVIFFALFLLPALSVFASHIVGGEMVYEFVSADPVAHTKTYKITLRLFRDQQCTACADMPAAVDIGIYSNNGKVQFPGPKKFFNVKKAGESNIAIAPPACIANPPNLEYHIGIYTIESVVLPDNDSGYTAAFQTCCRVAPLENVANNVDAGIFSGSTYACNIPGTAQLGTGINNSPSFVPTISTICAGRKFKLDFSASDKDGDQLIYSLTPAYSGGAARNAGFNQPAAPAYGTVKYINSYQGEKPLGALATIDARSGIISGIAPPQGSYVVSVRINELRNGVSISTHYKDFIVTVSGCDVAGAALMPSYLSCNDNSYTFQNLNTSPLNNRFLWDFGDGQSSSEPSPTHTYADTGLYKVKLLVNENGECGDSTQSQIGIYPGLTADFATTACKNNPTQFQDRSQSKYGTLTGWAWNFGDETTGGDVSLNANPGYTYPTPGHKLVQLTVTDSKGCTDTALKDIIVIGKPFAGNDTTVVAGQPLQFGASDGVAFTWLPATGLNSGGMQNPVGLYNGSYDSIRYKVLIYNDPNCVDSAFVTVHIFKTTPQVFVPTAFTPNGDGRNDVFLPVTAGIAQLTFVRVFNRWGQLVFETSRTGQSWDGRLKGQEQPTGTFVWLVQGVDYTGATFFKKGTLLLIR